MLRQDYPSTRYEIVIANDGGEPPRLAGLQEAGGPPIRILHLSKGGPAAARNRGAAVADGSLLAFTDDDYRPRPDWLAALAREAAKAPDAVLGGYTRNGIGNNPFAEASRVLIDFSL